MGLIIILVNVPAPVAVILLKIEKLDVGIRAFFPAPVRAARKGFTVKLRPWIPDLTVIAGKGESVRKEQKYRKTATHSQGSKAQGL